MGILDTPLSKRGILKALGQDPEKSNVLTVATSPSGGVNKKGGKCPLFLYSLFYLCYSSSVFQTPASSPLSSLFLLLYCRIIRQ